MIMHQYLLYTLLPMGAICLAALFVMSLRPRGIFINAIQAFSAGILLAGISLELFPKLDLNQYGLAVSITLLCGLVLMLLLHKLSPGCCGDKARSMPLSPFLAAFCVEFFLNGIIITLSGLAGHLAAFIVALSLGICCFVCGMSVATRLLSRKFSRKLTWFCCFMMSLLLPLGGFLASLFVAHMSIVWIDSVIAFGIGVLLYLATADLLIEAFQKPNSSLRVIFFLGFIVVILIKTLLGA